MRQGYGNLVGNASGDLVASFRGNREQCIDNRLCANSQSFRILQICSMAVDDAMRYIVPEVVDPLKTRELPPQFSLNSVLIHTPLGSGSWSCDKAVIEPDTEVYAAIPRLELPKN